MTSWREIIHRNHDPYAGFPIAQYTPDVSGWGFDSPIFEHVIQSYHPQVIIEVGSWKGASAITMAKLLCQYGITTGQVICVDTWLGSVNMWLEEPRFGSLQRRHGRPDIYHVFLANVIRNGYTGMITPFPVDSSTAAKFFTAKKLFCDALYLDASHEYQDVLADLNAWWPLVRPGGVLFGDDYSGWWPEVVKAVNEFAGKVPVDTGYHNKFLIEKP